MTTSADRKRLLEQRIRGASVGATSPRAVATRPRIVPSSHSQRRLWFLEQLQESQSPYTLNATQELTFEVDIAILERSLVEIAGRHEVLRTTFEMQADELVQVISQRVGPMLKVIDLASLPVEERSLEAMRLMGLSAAKRFDLATGPLLRTEIYRLSPTDWRLIVMVHHIIFDGPSFQVFFRELNTVYGALAAGLAPPPLPPTGQYADFARAQLDLLTSERVEAEVAFWRSELAHSQLLDLPLDHARPTVPSFRGSIREITIDPAVTRRLQLRAASAQTTLFTVLLSGFWAALSRLCSQTDFSFGVPVTGRDTRERENAIGLYVDTVVVRPRPQRDDPTAEDVLQAGRAALARSLSHRHLPFETIVQHLAPERDLALNPFFQVGFQLMEYFILPSAGGADLTRSSAMFDLGLDLWPQGEGIAGRLEYNSDLFERATIDLVAHYFSGALDWITNPQAQLADLDLGKGLPPEQISRLAGDQGAASDLTCLDIIDEIAVRDGASPAVEFEDQRLSYGELIERVDRLASALKEHGVSRETTVVLEVDRSLDLVCLQLASWRLGAAFVCFDPAWPVARGETILADIEQPVRIDKTTLALLAPADQQEATPAARPDDVAYMILTSGSTGRAKAVVIDHRGLTNVALAQRALLASHPGRRVAQLSAPVYDASIFEMVLALCSGGTLIVAPPGIHAGEALEELLSSTRSDTVVLPPSVLLTLRPDRVPSLAMVCAAGESCPADLAATFAHYEFWNLYGPTETTIWATAGRASFGSRVTIGRPIRNTETLVVDSKGRPVPVGVAGELWVSGPGVARGYLNQPDRTAERFVTDHPILKGRSYRTGDVVRQIRDGGLVFLGRADRQTKIRGVRIELEEIESVLRGVVGVLEAVAEAVPIDGQATLVAYVQIAPGTDPESTIQTCRALLRSSLPIHMSPSRFVPVASFARSAGGKIDRKSLPLPEATLAPARTRLLPRTTAERQVADLMAHVLRVNGLGADDDFFHVGGHSLAAVRLASRARAVFGVTLSIADIFSHSTVAELASFIEGLKGMGQQSTDQEFPLQRLPRVPANASGRD